MIGKPRSSRKWIAAFGLALVASVAFSASAMGTEGAPENTIPPYVSGAPYGSKASTGLGKWTNSPTSYSFEWYRCNSSGAECAVISGATSSSYLVAEADIGHTLKSRVTAYNKAGQGSAFSNASGVVPIPPEYWIAGGSKIAEGTPTSFAMNSSSTFAFRFFLGLSETGEIKLSCTSQKASGTAENPTGGATGTGVNIQFTLSGCTVTVPPKGSCKLASSEIEMVSLKAEGTALETKPAVKFMPASGSTLFSVTLKECKTSAYNGTYYLEGSFIGTANKSTSSLEFTNAGSAGFRWAGVPAYFTGTSKIETSGGSTLTVAP